MIEMKQLLTLHTATPLKHVIIPTHHLVSYTLAQPPSIRHQFQLGGGGVHAHGGDGAVTLKVVAPFGV